MAIGFAAQKIASFIFLRNEQKTDCTNQPKYKNTFYRPSAQHDIVITGSIARSAGIYAEADFEVFRPAGRHVAPMGLNLAWMRGPKLRSSPPRQISPNRCNNKGIRSQN